MPHPLQNQMCVVVFFVGFILNLLLFQYQLQSNVKLMLHVDNNSLKLPVRLELKRFKMV